MSSKRSASSILSKKTSNIPKLNIPKQKSSSFSKPFSLNNIRGSNTAKTSKNTKVENLRTPLNSMDPNIITQTATQLWNPTPRPSTNDGSAGLNHMNSNSNSNSYLNDKKLLNPSTRYAAPTISFLNQTKPKYETPRNSLIINPNITPSKEIGKSSLMSTEVVPPSPKSISNSKRNHVLLHQEEKLDKMEIETSSSFASSLISPSNTKNNTLFKENSTPSPITRGTAPSLKPKIEDNKPVNTVLPKSSHSYYSSSSLSSSSSSSHRIREIIRADPELSFELHNMYHLILMAENDRQQNKFKEPKVYEVYI